jgi:UDP-N-acetylglucosamine:LPS N-acetylglucosamine transferase
LKHISKQRLDAQILIVCGRHKRLAAQAQHIKDKNPHLQLQIYGFVDNVDALIHVSDIILTK